MARGQRAGGEEVELDADGELAAAIAALKEAAWRLRLAAHDLEEEYGMRRAVDQREERSACVAVADVLALQIDAVGTHARRLRKRAREI